MTPDIEATLTTEGLYPGETSLPFSSKGKKAMVVKNCAVTLVSNVCAHCSGSLCMKCSEIALAEVQSGVPALENRVLSSLAMPALSTSRWIPRDSLLASSSARCLISSLLDMSPERAMILPGPVLYCSTTVFNASCRRPVM